MPFELRNLDFRRTDFCELAVYVHEICEVLASPGGFRSIVSFKTFETLTFTFDVFLVIS